MITTPIAAGGVGGSGTRIISLILQDLGVFIGSRLPESLDTVWYAALFGRREVVLEPDAVLKPLVQLFFRQMADPQPLSPEELALVKTFGRRNRHQHTQDTLHAWTHGFIRHGETGQKQAFWGWKVPYTYVLIDKLLRWQPNLKYIHMTRNGLDMAYSKNQNQLTHWGPLFLNRNVKIGPRDSLSFWCAVHRYVEQLTLLHPGRIHHVNFDRLMENPEREIQALLVFLEVDPTAELVTHYSNFVKPPPTIGRGGQNGSAEFEPDDLAYANEVAAQAKVNVPGAVAAVKTLEQEIAESKLLRAGSSHWRAFVGPPEQYDFMGATQFRLLTGLGLREEHCVVDIGCGSLRAGRLLITYLMPGRYTGVEPNSWLWRTAFRRELGTDVLALKSPVFLQEDNFKLCDISADSVDFVVAQSIYSHTAIDLFKTSVASVSRILAPTGQFLFTVILPHNLGADSMRKGVKAEGWTYPECVTFTSEQVATVCEGVGLRVQQLDWYHPRQTWFRAVAHDALLLSDTMLAGLGDGKPLFDERFA